MKEKSFKLKENYYNAVKTLDDKQVGKLMKGLCAYVFERRYFESNDAYLKSIFGLIKGEIDRENFYREKGKQGGVISAQMKRDLPVGLTVVAELKEQNCPMEEILKAAATLAGQDKGDKQ